MDSVICVDLNGSVVRMQEDQDSDSPALALWAMDKDNEDFIFLQLGIKESLQLRNALDKFLGTHTNIPTKEELNQKHKALLECLDQAE